MCRGTPVPRTACSSAASCRLVSLNSQAPGCCGQRKTSSFSLVQGFPTYLATEHYLFGCLLVSLISMTSILPNNLLWNSYEMTNIAATEILIVRLCSSIVWMSARAAMKKYHRMDDINDRHLFPHSSEAGNPKLSWFSVRPVSWFVDDCLPTVFSPGLPSSPAYAWEREISGVIASSTRTSVLLSGPHPYDITSLKALSPNTVSLRRKAATDELGENTIQYMTNYILLS